MAPNNWTQEFAATYVKRRVDAQQRKQLGGVFWERVREAIGGRLQLFASLTNNSTGFQEGEGATDTSTVFRDVTGHARLSVAFDAGRGEVIETIVLSPDMLPSGELPSSTLVWTVSEYNGELLAGYEEGNTYTANAVGDGIALRFLEVFAERAIIRI
jgi:hypothetical protein